jgi:hypothetical protein
MPEGEPNVSDRDIGFGRLLILVALLGYLGGQILHEAGHWAVLQLFERGPVMSFTGLVQREELPTAPERWVEFPAPDGQEVWLHLASLSASSAEWVAMLAAGPLAQLAAMILGLLLAHFARRETVRSLGLLLALINSFGPALYQLTSTLGGPGGDEYFIAYYLGLSRHFISASLGLASAAGLVLALRELSGWRMRLKWGAALSVGLLPQGPLLMMAYRITQSQVDLGHPLFRPVIGWSLPVAVTSALACLALLVLLVRWEKRPSPVP